MRGGEPLGGDDRGDCNCTSCQPAVEPDGGSREDEGNQVATTDGTGLRGPAVEAGDLRPDVGDRRRDPVR